MAEITHTYIHPECGSQAFNFVGEPTEGDRLRACDVRLLDGSTPTALDRPKCGNCGEELSGLSIRNIRPLGELDAEL